MFLEIKLHARKRQQAEPASLGLEEINLLRKRERAEVLGTQHPCGEVGSWRNSEFHSPENMVWHLLSRF